MRVGNQELAEYVVSRFELPMNHTLRVSRIGPLADLGTLQIEIATFDTRQLPDVVPIRLTHQTAIPPFAYDSVEHMKAFVRQCMINATLHELDEWLRFDGQMLNDPHTSDFKGLR